jgi:type IV secretory pathway VirB10-like protein
MTMPWGVGRAFSIAGSVVLIAIAIGMYVTHKQPETQTKPEETKTVPGAGSWIDRDSFPPKAPPDPSASPGVIKRVGSQLQAWHTGNTGGCNEDCQAKRRFLAAVEGADMNVPIPGQNALEIPGNNQPLQTASTKPLCTAHCLLAGQWLYATLETGVNSDRPGAVTARISQDMRDLKNEILVPFGSELIGKVEPLTAINLNKQAVDVGWDTLKLPNGAEVQLPHLQAADVDGYPGLTGDVDRHLAQKWGPALMVSAINATMMLAQNPTYGSSNGYGSTQIATGAFASSMGQQSLSSLSDLLQQVRPTVVISKGTEFRVLISRDIPFDKAWEE